MNMDIGWACAGRCIRLSFVPPTANLNCMPKLILGIRQMDILNVNSVCIIIITTPQFVLLQYEVILDIHITMMMIIITNAIITLSICII